MNHRQQRSHFAQVGQPKLPRFVEVFGKIQASPRDLLDSGVLRRYSITSIVVKGGAVFVWEFHFLSDRAENVVVRGFCRPARLALTQPAHKFRKDSS